MAKPNFPARYQILLVFLNMATYHVCVLIWFYYPARTRESCPYAAGFLPENKLEVWNQELERLLHK